MTFEQRPVASEIAQRLFIGDGEMATRMREHDWSATSLGAPEQWPQSLRTAVSICLDSRFPILIWWGDELTMLYNDAYRPVLGMTKHPRALGAAGRDIWPEIWDIIGPMLTSVLTEGQATWSDDQLLVLERNGYPEECYFTFSYSPIRDETGRVAGVFTAVTETTGRVLGERRLRVLRDIASATVEVRSVRATAQLATRALQTNPEDIPFALLYLLDDSGASATLAGTTGVAPADRTFPEHLDLRAPGETPLARLLADMAASGWQERPYALPATFALADSRNGPPTPSSALILPVTQANQERPTALLVAGVSPRRALDDDYHGFFGLVANHTGSAIADARAYEEERQRAEALAELDRAKTTFFSSVSHEFRTPLTLMLGPLSDMLSDDVETLSPSQRAELAVVHRNGLRLLKLVNTLLDFARIEAGRAQAHFEPTDLPVLTADLASAFRSLIEKAGMELIVDCPPLNDTLDPVYVDRDMWEKIVLNLLSNAFKFTFEGSITVALHPDAATNAVVLSVSDTGTGVPADELPRLFERFHRVEGARARTFEGSGIGLALVQELVNLHGGTIEAESAQGVGTTLRVRLPLGTGHVPSERPRGRPAAPSTALGTAPFVAEAERWLPDIEPQTAPATMEPVDGTLRQSYGRARQPARVLIADDNADMRGYLARLLGERYSVEAVHDGYAALEAIKRERPDVVLADIMMPSLDGFALLRTLRADPATSTLPVILLSARAGVEATVEGLDAGADDYLVKPFSAREVMSRVAARLEIARAHKEAVRSEARFRAVADSAPVMIWMANVERLHTYFNQGWLDFTGHTLEWEHGHGWIESIHPEDQERRIRVFADSFDARVPFTIEYRLRRHDGAYRWVLDHGVPLFDPDGAFTGYIGSSIDITERKLAEDQKDEFLGIASHELRTPLTSLAVNVQLAERQLRTTREAIAAASLSVPNKADERAHTLLERSARQVKRLDRLVGDLLDVSRIHAGQLEMRIEPCDLLAIAREAVEAQRTAWPERTVMFEAPAERQVPLLADADRIGQVVTNYLTNALKYAPVEEPITVRVRVTDGTARVEVEDRGPGLTDEQKERLFERFYRAPGIEHWNGSGVGLGLGLYICKTIVKRHDGRVGVESTPDGGSTFWFTVPLAR